MSLLMACTPLDQSWIMAGIKIEKKRKKVYKQHNDK